MAIVKKVDKRSKEYRDSLKKLPTLEKAIKDMGKSTKKVQDLLIADIGKIHVGHGEKEQKSLSEQIQELRQYTVETLRTLIDEQADRITKLENKVG